MCWSNADFSFVFLLKPVLGAALVICSPLSRLRGVYSRDTTI
ncbi:hypothetical protein AGR4B_Cc60186 [Agrobacterium tumefaciens str. CFBP 5621]|nr:hypothetical protein AGR4B_Cc60186 [Agrobacterium tumefaciens str. CFBP 5621]